MATFTINSTADRFPVGTTVGAYPAESRRDGGAPNATAVATSVVGVAGGVALAGLTDDTAYVLYALVAGAHRYLQFRTSDPVPVVVKGRSVPVIDLRDALPGEALGVDGLPLSVASEDSLTTVARRTALRQPRRVAPPGVKLRGMNICPAVNAGYGGGWAQMFAEWPWDAYIKTQVDEAKAAGANALRLIGGVGAVKAGSISLETYVARYEQFVSYARDQDMYVLAVGVAFGHVNGATNADLAEYLGELIPMLNRYENVVALELSQEPFGEGYSRLGSSVAAYLLLSAPAREVLDQQVEDDCEFLRVAAIAAGATMPLGFSSSTPFADQRTIRMLRLTDYLDFHVYDWSDAVLTGANAAAISTIQGHADAVGKPFMFGEWGHVAVTFTGTRTDGNATLTGVSSTDFLVAGMLVEGTGITAGTTIQSIGAGTVTLSAPVSGSGVTTVNLEPNRERRANRVRACMERPEFDGAFIWAVRWPAGAGDYGFYDAAGVERARVAAIFRMMPTKDDPWVLKVQQVGGAITLDNALNVPHVACDTGALILGRACRVEAVFSCDLGPSTTGQTYQTWVSGTPLTLADNPLTASALEARHTLVFHGQGIAPADTLFSLQGLIRRAVGASVNGVLWSSHMTLEFTPV